MTYCVGVLLNDGIVLASDSRTNAGVDNFATFCKMTVFERAGDRVHRAAELRQLGRDASRDQRVEAARDVTDGPPNLWTARTMFDVAVLVSDAMRDIERRDASFLETGPVSFNASFIVGGQIKGEPPRLFRIYAEGNFIEAGADTPFLQTGEAKYGKPIIDRVITPATTLADATKCILVSFDSTMRSNLSVGMPIDLVCYERDSLGDPHAAPLRTGRRLFHGAKRRMERGRAQGVPGAARSRMVSRRSIVVRRAADS